MTDEDLEQIAVADFCEVSGIPFVHIPNEGKRSPVTGAKLKRMGMKKGFPDIFIPIAKNGFHGLFIEMKVGKNKPSKEQLEWLKLLYKNGYAVCVRWGADETIKSIKNYLEEKKK